MGMGGKGGGQGFYQNPQQQQGGSYGQPGLMGFPDQGYQQPMQPMQPMQSSQPPPGYGAPGLGGIAMTPEIMAADAQRRQERGLPPNVSSYQQNYGGGYGPVSQFGGRGVSPQMQNWAASNPNSPFLPNDAPNPFYNGPPVSQFGGRGGPFPGFNPDGSPIGTGGYGRPVGGPNVPNVQKPPEIRTMPVTPIPQPQPMPQVRPQVQAPQVQAPQVQAPQPNFVPFVGADGGPVQVARAPEPPRVVRRRRGR